MTTRRNASHRPATPDGQAAGQLARRVAHDAVAALLGRSRGLALDDALAQGSADIDPEEAALARAIAVASFRRLGFLRAALAERMTQGLPESQPRLLALLVTGAVQILELAVPDHAAVDLSVRLCKADPQLHHLSGLVNAVLRRIARERETIDANEVDPLDVNTPAWLARRWRAAYGEDTARAIATSHLQGAAVDLSMRAEDAADWAQRLGGTALDLGSVRLHGEGAIASLPGFADGAWWVQDAAAALPARLLGVRAGERVADLCAAPGGKTAQLAAIGASVTAVDRSAARLERLRANLQRLRLAAEIRVVDALELEADTPFDAVLLDAPCSATGTIRRHPDVAWTKTEADIGRLAGLQSRLLDRAAGLVRPGGRLVYCSCSLEPEEGERQAEAFLARHPEFARDPVRAEEIGGHAELIDGWGDLRTLPSHLPVLVGTDGIAGRGGLDGFFGSRLHRMV